MWPSHRSGANLDKTLCTKMRILLIKKKFTQGFNQYTDQKCDKKKVEKIKIFAFFHLTFASLQMLWLSEKTIKKIKPWCWGYKTVGRHKKKGLHSPGFYGNWRLNSEFILLEANILFIHSGRSSLSQSANLNHEGWHKGSPQPSKGSPHTGEGWTLERVNQQMTMSSK